MSKSKILKAVEATEHATRTLQIFAAIGTSSSKQKGLLKPKGDSRFDNWCNSSHRGSICLEW
jgi:hypothetical protein